MSSRLHSLGRSVAEAARSLMPPLLVLLVFVVARAATYGLLMYAQTTPPLFAGCPEAKTVKNFVSAIGIAVLMGVLVIAAFLVVFNTLGTVSTMMIRIGEFFNERIRFVFELILIYVFFMWNLPEAIKEVEGGCAAVDYVVLLNNGPLMFRIVGMILSWLGIKIS